jgi:hypothetical protein
MGVAGTYQPTEGSHDDSFEEALDRACAHSRVECSAHKLSCSRVVKIDSDLALVKGLAVPLQLNLDCVQT